MSLSLSRLAGALPPSATLRLNSLIAALRSKGEKIISLCAGEPDFDTPEHIRKAAVQALENGCTRYTDVAGILPLRKAVCRRLYQDKGVSYTPEQILGMLACSAGIIAENRPTSLGELTKAFNWKNVKTGDIRLLYIPEK